MSAASVFDRLIALVAVQYDSRVLCVSDARFDDTRGRQASPGADARSDPWDVLKFARLPLLNVVCCLQALEGGYSLSATAVSAAACMEALLGIRCGLPRFDPPLQQHSACESQVLKPCFLADEGLDLRRDGRESPAAPGLLLAPFLRPLNKRSHPPARFRLASNQIARAITTKSANDDECDKGARKALEQTRAVHAPYWRCLRNPSEGR